MPISWPSSDGSLRVGRLNFWSIWLALPIIKAPRHLSGGSDGLDLTAAVESSVEEAQPLDSLAGGVFVGRQREMGELKACLEDALHTQREQPQVHHLTREEISCRFSELQTQGRFYWDPATYTQFSRVQQKPTGITSR